MAKQKHKQNDINLINFAETYAFTCKKSLRIAEKCYMRNLSELNKEWKVVLHMSCCYKIQIRGRDRGPGEECGFGKFKKHCSGRNPELISN